MKKVINWLGGAAALAMALGTLPAQAQTADRGIEYSLSIRIPEKKDSAIRRKGACCQGAADFGRMAQISERVPIYN